MAVFTGTALAIKAGLKMLAKGLTKKAIKGAIKKKVKDTVKDKVKSKIKDKLLGKKKDKRQTAKNIMQQISLSQTEYLSNNGAYFESDSSGSCDTTATLAQSNAINDHVLESEVIDPTKIGFNFCKTYFFSNCPGIIISSLSFFNLCERGI